MTLLTADICFKAFGAPDKESSMTVLDIHPELHIKVIPNHIYCNKAMVKPLTEALHNVIARGCTMDIRTWDGCFNIRSTRGASGIPSLHSWGLAIDLNAAWNPLGKQPTMHKDLVSCFTDAGFDWGGHWSRPDGMHFQLTKETLDLYNGTDNN